MATVQEDSIEQIQVCSGYQAGQTINDTDSYADLTTDGSGIYTVQVVLAQTNQPGASFQPYYKLDGGAPVATGVLFTTDIQGNGTGSFTVTGLPYGAHTLAVDVNNTPVPGNTYYLTASDIPFTLNEPTF